MVNSTYRKNYILAYLEKNYTLKINELSKVLKVTRETIRKDLYELAEAGLIRKIHGGAVIENNQFKASYENRKADLISEKEIIARIAASYIERGDCIYLDYGTTAFCLAKEIAKMSDLTVVTNSIQNVNILMSNQNIDIIVLGGKLRKNEDSLFGSFALNNLNNIFVNYGFFGCGGIDPNVGLTNHNSEEAHISREVFKRSQVKIVLADHTKFSNIALNRVATPHEIDIIITDQETDVKIRDIFSQKSVEIQFPTSRGYEEPGLIPD